MIIILYYIGIQRMRTLAVSTALLGSTYSYTASSKNSELSVTSTNPNSFASSTASSATSKSTTPTITHAHRYSTEYQKLFPNIIVIDSRAIKVLFTILRDENTLHFDFSTAADRLMSILAEEGLAYLPGVQEKTVNTPCGIYHGLQELSSQNLCAVSIVRAGDALLQSIRKIKPDIPVGKILIQRNENTKEKFPQLFYVKLPNDIHNRTVILVDPMLATGQSAKLAIEELINRGVPEEKIVFLNVVSCPEGITILHNKFPKVKIITAAVDEGLNQNKYIVPGLGDFGDRYFGTD